MTEMRFDDPVVVVKEIKYAGGQAVACCASVADEYGAKAIVDMAIDAFGRIDAVINNAGIHDPAAFDALSIEQFQAMLDVHFFGSLFVSRAAWPHFVKARYGRIVNTVSEAMLGGIPELTSYGPAKGAVLTAADIAEHLDQIMDLNDAQVTESTRSVM